MRGGKFSRPGCAFCLWVGLGEREVTENESKPPAEMALHVLDDGKSHPASGTLIVAILDERHGRI
jgi:hypothetical protein